MDTRMLRSSVHLWMSTVLCRLDMQVWTEHTGQQSRTGSGHLKASRFNTGTTQTKSAEFIIQSKRLWSFTPACQTGSGVSGWCCCRTWSRPAGLLLKGFCWSVEGTFPFKMQEIKRKLHEVRNTPYLHVILWLNVPASLSCDAVVKNMKKNCN